MYRLIALECSFSAMCIAEVSQHTAILFGSYIAQYLVSKDIYTDVND